MKISKAVILIVSVLVGLIVWLAVDEVSTVRTALHVVNPAYDLTASDRGRGEDGMHIDLDLRLAQLDHARQVVTGVLRLSLRPTNPALLETVQDIEKAELTFHRHHVVDGGSALLRQGKSDEVVELTPTTTGVEMAGEEGFTWQVEEVRPPLYYPFDRYALYVNPMLATPADSLAPPGSARILRIDTAHLFAGLPNMRLHTRLPVASASSASDWRVLTLSRPVALQVLAAILALLALIWMYYLIKLNDTKALVGNLLAFFLGVWGLRSTLFAGTPIFPALLDYLLLVLSVAAAGIVVSKWFEQQEAPPPHVCPHCLQPVDEQATRCPHCTSQLQPAAP